MNKYKINEEGRVVALKDFSDVKKGDVGGFVEKGSNLSQTDTCWVSGDARVFGNAKVCGYARVYGNAKVYNTALVYGNAYVSGDARVFGNAYVYSNAMVFGNANIYGNARVYGDAKVYGYSQVYGDAYASGDARVYGNAKVSGKSEVFGDAVATKPVQFIITNKHNITLTDTHIAIGCENHTIEHWEEHIESIGKDNGYSDDEIIYTTMMIDGMLGLGGTK